ncbi:hypothetical protein E2562_000646 [Oryza meyeriana var. granulata]|uniref:60S acidic ribosomal protein P2 n=1 Tax=Oryza meyeriana var. granulata TaxID=110450 RepID=A0A6G1DUB7_9ORYZ|nr:hypothetical protein E2562_000646 [Oryza meyeriana var. granulata]
MGAEDACFANVLGSNAASSVRMKFVAAYLMAVLAGNSNPTAEDLTTILESVGCEIDNEKMKLLLSEVSGKDITELIAAGREKLLSHEKPKATYLK